VTARRSIRAEAIRYANNGVARGSTRLWIDLYHERYRQLAKQRTTSLMGRIGR
jgi:hypothetical protein